MQEKVEELFKSYMSSQIGGKSLHLITAYSGGPDSSVLLYLLHKFQKEFSYTLSAAYINHNIRSADEMRDEQDAVISRAEDLGVDLQLKIYPPGFIEDYARKTGLGVEGAARSCRYHFFYKLLKYRRPAALVLGHNRNDQLETLLMRVFQGTGSTGLKGIPREDPDRLRPLIDVSREDILAYAALKNIPYCNDSTNSEGDYRRNRIRKDLIPVLRDIFPQPDKALFQLSREISSLAEALKDGSSWEGVKGTEGWRISTDKFYSLPFPVRKTLVLEKMNELNRGLLPRDTRIPGRFFKPLEQISSASNGRIRTLLKGYNIILEEKGGFCILRREQASRETGFFHLLTRENPFVTENFTLSLAEPDPESTARYFEFPPLGTLCIRRKDTGSYCLCHGSRTVLKLDNKGEMLHFLYGNKKKPENSHPLMTDCVIIKLEVKDALG